MQEQAVLWIKGPLDVNNPLEEREKYSTCAVLFVPKRKYKYSLQWAQFNNMCSLLHACAWYLCYPTEWPCCSMPGCGPVLAWSHSSRHLKHQRVCSGQHTIVTKETETVIMCRAKSDHNTHCTRVRFHFDHHHLFSVNNFKRLYKYDYKFQSLECLCKLQDGK